MIPFLSICIPTFNRAKFLKATLESITSEPEFQDSQEVEILISNNCSTDETEEVCQTFVTKYPDKISYQKLNTAISGDENFLKVLNRGNGTFLKLHNDQVLFQKGSLGRILGILREQQDCMAIFFLNGGYWPLETTDGAAISVGFDQFMQKARHRATWIGGFCVSAFEFRRVKEPARFSRQHFGQIGILADILDRNGKSAVIPEQLFVNHPDFTSKREYFIPGVFGTQFKEVTDALIREQKLRPETRDLAQYFFLPIINFHFEAEVGWTPAAVYDYFRHMLPIYGKKRAFYFWLVRMVLKRALRLKSRIGIAGRKRKKA